MAAFVPENSGRTLTPDVTGRCPSSSVGKILSRRGEVSLKQWYCIHSSQKSYRIPWGLEQTGMVDWTWAHHESCN